MATTITPLHCAAKYGDNKALQFLIANGASIEKKAFGCTPSLLAASEGHLDILQYLIDRGVDPRQRDYHGRTVLHWAAKHGNQVIVQALIDKGANINAVDRWGRTVLMWAIEYAEGSMMEYDRDMLIRLLLRNGVNTGVKAQHGITALHMAAFVGSSSIMRYLLDEGMDLNVEAQWCEPHSDWVTDLAAVDVRDTKYHELCMLLASQCQRKRFNSQGQEIIVRGSKAYDIATRTGKFAVAQLLAARST